MESAENFSNFDDFATLIECDKDISYEAVYEILSKASKEDLIEIINGYFEDITENLSDDSMELFTLLGNVNNLLTGLLENEQDGNRTLFVDEFYRFKNYYTFGPPVVSTNASTEEKQEFTISEAIYNYRLEKLSKDRFFYDFSACQDYEIDEYTVGFSTSIELEEGKDYDSDTEEDKNYNSNIEEENEESQYLIDRENPVIDGEYEDEYEDEMGNPDYN